MTKTALNKKTLETSDARSQCTALHYCIMYDKKEYLKLLLRAGADQNIKNGIGLSCAELAVAYKNDEIKRLVRRALIWLPPTTNLVHFKANRWGLIH